MAKIKHVYDIVIAVEMDPAGVRATGAVPIIEPNGKSFCPLGKMRAGVVLDDDAEDREAEVKAIRTACHFFKEQNPEWKDSLLHGLSPELSKRTLVP